MNLMGTSISAALMTEGGMLVACAFLFPVTVLRAADVYVVAPNAYMFANGPNASVGAFLIEQRGLSSQRYQQVYDASQFSAVNPQGGFISTIFVRADENNSHLIMSTIGNIQIDLSTTPKPPDGLSTTFAGNVG